MEYLVTLIETTEHIVSVEADDECLARASAVIGWHDGDFIDDRPRLLDLEAVSIIEVPTEDVA
tara:strand:+ start:1688 stop:1876 length:189 start_codon:yes stop_codon:yes gene_type:complete